jgi:hypothetical protein
MGYRASPPYNQVLWDLFLSLGNRGRAWRF